MLIRIILIIVMLIGFGGFAWYSIQHMQNSAPKIQPTVGPIATNDATSTAERVSIAAQDLEIPWSLVFLPDNSILLTERPGRVRYIDSKGILREEPVITIDEVEHIGEGGLLGIDLHPEFESNKYVYIYYTYSSSGNNTLNRVVRYTFSNNTFSDPVTIVDQIPGARNHNGGRIKFGPDGFLYITTGDAQQPSLAQDRNSLAGKILRVTDEGKPAPGNPFNNRVYSYGHRNAQGLAWNVEGHLWATEHGRSGIRSGLDELNRIVSGANYGWPEIEGTETASGMETPEKNSGPDTTWAPGGAVFHNNSLFFTGLRGSVLYKTQFQRNEIQVTEHFKDEFGRLRTVVLGPDNLLYVLTSNTDGRGIPKANDDKLLRINPQKL